MPKKTKASKRDTLLSKATELFRMKGFQATSIDDICASAKVTKGAFFHYFKSKEELAKACLEQWKCMTIAMVDNAPFLKESDPLKKILGYIDFYLGAVTDPAQLKSCLAGTLVQEIWDTYPSLRSGANECFTTASDYLEGLLDEAAKHYRKKVDTKALAELYLATFQGSLILYKGSRDIGVFHRNFGLLKSFFRQQFSL